jgi:ABC-type nitrate/sulfonate/bicarbonate transport system permease component
MCRFKSQAAASAGPKIIPKSAAWEHGSVGMVIAEFFTQISGLGGIIINAGNNFDTATMFVPIILLMILAVGLNYLIGWFERVVAPWQAEIAGRDEN